MNFTNFFKKLIPDNIFFLLKKRSILKKKYFGLNELDKKVSKYIDYDNGYFIELGANDGISQSNTLYFEKFRNWRGILIEPVKFKFDQCLKSRDKNNLFYNYACVSSEFKHDHVELIYSNLRTVTSDKQNLIEAKNHIKSEDLNIYQSHKKLKVEAKTLNYILKKSKAPKIIDFLSLDTEGYEIEVLKGVDFEEYFFKYILVESKNFELINNYLIKKNYELLDKLSIHDYLYKKNEN